MPRLSSALILVLTIAHAGWAQSTFHGNLSRTGAYESPGPSAFRGIKWVFKSSGPIVSSPAVAGGAVFVGSSDTFLYAVDQRTGKERWRFKSEGPIASSAAVADGFVYFGSFDGIFYAINAGTGALEWKSATPGSERRFEAHGLHGTRPREQTVPDNWDFFTSSPAVSGGRVYVGSGDGNVYCMDARTGAPVWQFATSGVVHSSPSVVDGTVYVGSFDGVLYAIDALSGAEKWRFKTGEDPVNHNQVGFQSSPTVVDGVVYVGCRDAHVYAVDAKTGHELWKYDTRGAWVSATPAVRDGVVYVGTGDTNLFQALDARTGRLRFTFDAKAMIFSSAALAGDLAYVGTLAGRLLAFDTRSGKLAWQFETECARTDRLKVLNSDGSFANESFAPTFNDFQDMYVRMYMRFSVGSILSSPVVDQGEIYFGSTDGCLYAVE